MIFKTFYFLLILFFSFGSIPVEKVEGEYYNYFGSTLKINTDSTFIYTWRFDLMSSWTIGKWELKDRVVNFEVTPIYDTLRIDGKKDTLVLSEDDISGLINSNLNILSSGGQNRIPMHFSRLFFKDHKLYMIDNKGKIIKDKVKGNWGNKRYHTWFVKKN